MPNQRNADKRQKKGYLDESQLERLTTVLKHRGQGFSGWLGSMIDRCAVEIGLPGVRRLEATVSTTTYGDLVNLLRSRGQAFPQWLQAMVDRCANERLPESQGDVKKVIPAEVAAIAREVLELQGQMYLALADKITDKEERRNKRQEAGQYLDAAHWFADVLNERQRRLHILASGQRDPRHRVKDSETPATDSSSRTMEAPTA